MFRRVSANFLLQSVIAVVGVALVAALATGAFDAWRAVGTASRLQGLAEVAGHAFRAMHNLRIDRSFTVRALVLDGFADAAALRQIASSREAELPALASTIAALRTVDIANRDAVVAELDKANQALNALAKESAAEFNIPKAQRRATLPKEYETLCTDLLGAPDRLSNAARPFPTIRIGRCGRPTQHAYETLTSRPRSG